MSDILTIVRSLHFSRNIEIEARNKEMEKHC